MSATASSNVQVYTSLSNVAWQTDRVSISTGNTAVTYNVYLVALTYNDTNGNVIVSQAALGNLFSNAVSIPATTTQEVYVGVGNKLTIIGSNYTAQEIGTASSATAGVNGVING
jgi:hypothetical protein